jgi:hypothetical protein
VTGPQRYGNPPAWSIQSRFFALPPETGADLRPAAGYHHAVNTFFVDPWESSSSTAILPAL